ncbi:polysaccharide biosynthesis/export family protein [Paradevosia shaoguanensis]|uniref:Polysaccharide biosynthesis/export family protein n=1 Tax=Paradevosia shaoguanensis TaxID=1335043 RepID=A0AA41UDE6_9HYPH|nr:polysaccharide biosynthesis/export family protein [Paradevosia shaoguanensis]MCF1744769.1 polysaccharide biosynthesis/export family protein [Paradevosia shaoguanensis]MCI0129252.1 polysaccharide biosynthesis/export family protein [Paradevosia shaoguanensis]
MTLAPDRIRPRARHLIWLAVALTGFGTAQAGQPYALGISDKLNIKVVQWKAAESEFAEWSALSGEYVVGADGNVNFPMVGPTEGAGHTGAELAATLGTALQQTLGLATAPTVTVEVAEYGPIYVSGDVGAPGEYKFAPNLTVIKALTLAGGQRRGADAVSRPEREMLTTTGALDVLQDEYARLLIRRARLDAELAGKDEVPIPPELEGRTGLESLVAAEKAILDAQKRQAQTQSRSLTDQVALLNKQIESYQQKQTNTGQQLELARDQLGKITTLSDNGLALASRVASLQTNVGDLESRLLDSQTATLQAQQDIAGVEREQSRLSDQRISDLSLERQTVDGQIGALQLKIATQKGLVQEAAVQTGAAAVPTDVSPTYSYAIIRDGKEIPADLNTAVVPGDVVVARLDLAL